MVSAQRSAAQHSAAQQQCHLGGGGEGEGGLGLHKQVPRTNEGRQTIPHRKRVILMDEPPPPAACDSFSMHWPTLGVAVRGTAAGWGWAAEGWAAEGWAEGWGCISKVMKHTCRVTQPVMVTVCEAAMQEAQLPGPDKECSCLPGWRRPRRRAGAWRPRTAQGLRTTQPP